VKAATAGRLSEMMKITSEVTRAEAYTGSDMERGSVVLEVRGKEKGEFSVSQNEPNPWRSETVISYELPKAGDVKVTVMDISGKVVKTYNQRGKSGANSITLTREELGGATGVLIYKIESGADAVQRKMIVIE
jgi:alcohol dehydrogenase YqhD (iron-dependent ADH family)